MGVVLVVVMEVLVVPVVTLYRIPFFQVGREERISAVRERMPAEWNIVGERMSWGGRGWGGGFFLSQRMEWGGGAWKYIPIWFIKFVGTVSYFIFSFFYDYSMFLPSFLFSSLNIFNFSEFQSFRIFPMFSSCVPHSVCPSFFRIPCFSLF